MAPKESQAVQRRIGRLNAQKRWHPGTDTTELEQDLAACRISEHARRAEVVAARRLTTRVRRAAERALAPGEVLGVNNLALRIKSTDGLPGYHPCKAVLKALAPYNEHDDADLVGKGHQLFKVYRDDLGARPSHLFARHPDDVDAYAARRMARYEEQGRIGPAARLAKASA